jgi:NitT/TauT family transport system substrate-binding protein
MRRLTPFMVLLAALIIGASIYWQRNPPTSTAANVTVAQVGEFFVYMPLYLAEGKGYFHDQGLNVHVTNTGGDEKSVAAVITGSADFGIGDPTFAAIAGLKGQDVRVVAGILDAVPFWGVTKNPNITEITSPAQLKGLSVATFPAPSTAYTLQAQMFRSAGLTPNITQAQFGTLLPLLDTGRVDIVLELEPNVSIAVSQGARVAYSLASQYGEFATTGVTVSKKTLDTRHDVVERFVKAINQAEVFAHEHPDEAAAIAQAKFPSIDPQVAANALQRMLTTNAYPRAAAISDAAWRSAVQLRVDAGEIPSVEAAARFLDNSIASSLSAPAAAAHK